MSAPDDKERLAEIFEENRGGVTPVMWAALAFFGTLALAVILLIDPRGSGPASPDMQATHDQARSGQSKPGAKSGAPVETTGSAPREEIERRWPHEINP